MDHSNELAFSSALRWDLYFRMLKHPSSVQPDLETSVQMFAHEKSRT